MSSTFPRTRSKLPGYNVDQVEDFLEDARQAYVSDPALPTVVSSDSIRRTAFELQKGGYSPVHVDAALERLEDAFAQRERERAMSVPGGENAWFDEARSTAQTILDRLARPNGEKFSRMGALAKGYDVEEVDAFAGRLIDYFQSGTPMSIEEVRTVAFAPSRRGYTEGEVDYLLETVVKVMLAVR
jgi:DivIVA domain-containing protein